MIRYKKIFCGTHSVEKGDIIHENDPSCFQKASKDGDLSRQKVVCLLEETLIFISNKRNT